PGAVSRSRLPYGAAQQSAARARAARGKNDLRGGAPIAVRRQLPPPRRGSPAAPPRRRPLTRMFSGGKIAAFARPRKVELEVNPGVRVEYGRLSQPGWAIN